MIPYLQVGDNLAKYDPFTHPVKDIITQSHQMLRSLKFGTRTCVIKHLTFYFGE